MAVIRPARKTEKKFPSKIWCQRPCPISWKLGEKAVPVLADFIFVISWRFGILSILAYPVFYCKKPLFCKKVFIKIIC
jgi:hypothetical protein